MMKRSPESGRWCTKIIDRLKNKNVLTAIRISFVLFNYSKSSQ